MKMKSSLLCACAVVALAGPALAEPPIARPKDPAALKHLDVATKLYDIRSFEQAIEEYKAGALVEPAPVFDYDLAQCYRQLHKYKDAIWHYQRFLKESPETVEHDEAVKKFIEQMQAELDQKAMTAPPTEDANAPASAKPTTPAAPTPTAPTATNEDEETPPPATTDAWYRDPIGWSLVGGGVAALGASTYFLLDARSKDLDSNKTPGQTEQASLRDTAHSHRLIGGIVGGIGVAAVAAGVVKLVLHARSADEHTETAGLGIGITSNGFAVTGRF
jgi:tetratricopeptide (TPR) repeat protein